MTPVTKPTINPETTLAKRMTPAYQRSKEHPNLGWHVISGEELLKVLRRVEKGEQADIVYAELWANAEHEHVPPNEDVW